MKKRKNISISYILPAILLVCVGYGAISIPANAQVSVNNSSIAIKSSTDTPAPNETVNLSLQSYSIDLNRSEIAWKINGETKLSGTGETSFSFKSGVVGEKTEVQVSVKTGALDAIVAEKVFIPAEIDLLWEVLDGYTPPFYKGKTLPVSQSVIRATAIPHFTKDATSADADNFIYQWKKNYKYRDLNEQSGYGKKTVIFRNELLREDDLIEVEASSFSGNVSGKEKTIITQHKPYISFYENHPLQGILYEHSIGESMAMKNSEIEIIAEPYFFSIGNGGFGNLKFDWRINGKRGEENETNQRTIILRKNDNGGVANISLNIASKSNIIQFTQKTFNIEF